MESNDDRPTESTETVSRLIFRAVYDFASLEERARFIRSNPHTPPERMYRVRARRKSFPEEACDDPKNFTKSQSAEPCTDPTCPEHCPDVMGPPDPADDESPR